MKLNCGVPMQKKNWNFVNFSAISKHYSAHKIVHTMNTRRLSFLAFLTLSTLDMFSVANSITTAFASLIQCLRPVFFFLSRENVNF